MKHQHIVQPGNVNLSGSGHDKANPLATALRAKGFVPLPRLWVHGDALPELKKITDRYREEVNQTRSEVYGNSSAVGGDYGPLPISIDDEKEAAWSAHARSRHAKSPGA